MNIAFCLIEFGELSGGGGGERFFFDFFKDYQLHNPKHNLYLITTDLNSIHASGRTTDEINHKIINIKNLRYYNFRVFNFLNKKGVYFLGNLLMALVSYYYLKKYTIKKIFIISYSEREYYYYKTLNVLGCKTDYFFMDCRIPYHYQNNDPPFFFQNAYKKFFTKIKFDTIHTWYHNVQDYIRKNSIIPRYNTIVVYDKIYLSVKNKTANIPKRNIIIYASRLDLQKDPIFFLKAILKIKKELVSRQWKVYLFGTGILEHEVMQFIEINSMTDIITRKISSSLYPFFLESKIYVSTQKYENYSSLTILEAMSCGNVIIAKNVGQTSSFITNGINGFLCEENNPDSLSDAVLKAIDLKDDEFQLISHNNKNSIEKNYSLKNFTDLFNKAVEQ